MEVKTDFRVFVCKIAAKGLQPAPGDRLIRCLRIVVILNFRAEGSPRQDTRQPNGRLGQEWSIRFVNRIHSVAPTAQSPLITGRRATCRKPFAA